GRASEADRRVLRAGPALRVAPSRRPRQHDAGPGVAVGPRPRLREGAGVLHGRRPVGGVRGNPRRREPDAAPAVDETGWPRPARALPGVGAPAQADRDPTMELPAGRPDRRGDRPRLDLAV